MRLQKYADRVKQEYFHYEGLFFKKLKGIAFYHFLIEWHYVCSTIVGVTLIWAEWWMSLVVDVGNLGCSNLLALGISWYLIAYTIICLKRSTYLYPGK